MLRPRRRWSCTRRGSGCSDAAPGPGCRITASTSGSSTTASTTTSTMASPGGPGRACLTGRSSTYSSSRSDEGDHHEPPLRLSGPDEVHQALRSEEHTSELQSLAYLVCRLLLEKKKKKKDSMFE